MDDFVSFGGDETVGTELTVERLRAALKAMDRKPPPPVILVDGYIEAVTGLPRGTIQPPHLVQHRFLHFWDHDASPPP